MDMTSSKPYLIRAMYEWITDNGMTPHILVDAEAEGVDVPEKFISEGKIVLNISPQAVTNLQQNNEWVLFSARFSGQHQELRIPVDAVLAIYARENGRGMVLETDENESSPDRPPSGERRKTKKPHLQIVK